MTREFDLNIEKVLEHWTLVHALREVIANALDERALSDTKEPEIFRDDAGRVHVRDFGRGLRYEHLTQNESTEKHARPDEVVGGPPWKPAVHASECIGSPAPDRIA